MANLVNITFGSFTLLDQASAPGRCDFDPLHSEECRWEQQVQKEYCVDGCPAKLFGRGGVLYTVSFTIEREHASAAAAFLHKLTYPASFPTTVGSTVFALDVGGSATFAHGIIQSCAITQLGCRTTENYTALLVP